MKILHSTEEFQLSRSRTKQRDAHAILQRAAHEPDLASQARSARNIVVIGGVPTHWSPPLYAGGPCYISTMADGNQRFILLDSDPLNVAVYDGRGDLWLGRVLTCLPELILAILPKHAFQPLGNEATASAPQLHALRRLLNLPADHALPKLHTAVVSRIIDRVALANILPPLVTDLRSWIEASVDEHAA
ncbi:MAG: hypothetical protein NTV51_10525 [Verrucomicrobia bacterium]|nr:hypothetical protein [Verrucomicrobiota bacterium]